MQIKKEYKKIFIYFILSHLICYGFLYLFYPIFKSFFPQLNFYTIFDAEHYTNIAKYGYGYDYSEYAFFPFFPLILKIFGKIPTLILNNIFNLLSGIILYEIISEFFKDKNSLKTVKLFYFSPVTIYTCILYTESIFILLTFLLYLLYRKKEKYLLQGLLLGCAVASRSPASLLFFSIFIFMCINIYKKQETILNLFKVFIPATIISSLYPIYLFIKEGDLLLFMHIQFTHWYRIKTNFLELFKIQYIKINNTNEIVIKIVFIIETILYIYFIGLLIYGIIKYIKKAPMISLYTILTFYITTTSCNCIESINGAMLSCHRFFYACLGFIIFMPNKKFFRICNFLAMIITTALFSMGIYFY